MADSERPLEVFQLASYQQSGSLHQTLGRWRLHKKPKTYIYGGLWLLGLYLIFLAPAPRKLTDEALDRYEAILTEAEAYNRKNQPSLEQPANLTADAYCWQKCRALALRSLQDTSLLTAGQKRAVVSEKKRAEREARAVLRKHEKHIEGLLSQAKAELGLFSELGLEEGRRLFWQSFQAGKVFGRRQTFWDTALQLITSQSQDSNLLTAFVRLICTAAVNFTAGMLCSIFLFAFQLPSMVMSYQASWLAMLGFTCLALLGAMSVIISFLAGLYAAGATAIYASVSLAASQQTIAGGSRRQHPALRQHID